MKTRSKICATGGLIGLIIGVGLYFWVSEKGGVSDRTQGSDTETTADSTLSEERSQQDEVTKKKRRLLHNLRQLAASSNDDGHDEVPALEVVRETTRRIIRDSHISEDHIERLPGFLDEVVSEQFRNSRWENKIVSEIEERLSIDPTAALVEAACYETVCRIVTKHPSEVESTQFYDEARVDATSELRGIGHRFVRDMPDGTVTSTYYMARAENAQAFDDAAYNRMYEAYTGKRFEDIEPTEEQLAYVLSTMKGKASGEMQ